MKKYLFLYLSFLFLSSCALAPFTEPHTARTLGKEGNEWALAGGGPSYFSANYTRGLTDRLDFGGSIEYQSLSYTFGLHGKYLLTPETEDDPTALFFGLGFGATSQYAFFGAIKSYRITPRYELGLSGRANVIHWDFDDSAERTDASDYMDDLIGDFIADINGVYSYVSIDASNTYWVTKRHGLTLSVSRLEFVSGASGGTFKYGLKMHYNY